MTDESQPSTDKVRSKTMHPALRERLQRPVYQRMSSPPGGAVIITGIRPPGSPAEPSPPPESPPGASPPSAPRAPEA